METITAARACDKVLAGLWQAASSADNTVKPDLQAEAEIPKVSRDNPMRKGGIN